MLTGIALIFVSLLVLNLPTGAGAYIKHERDLYAVSAVYYRKTRNFYRQHFRRPTQSQNLKTRKFSDC